MNFVEWIILSTTIEKHYKNSTNNNKENAESLYCTDHFSEECNQRTQSKLTKSTFCPTIQLKTKLLHIWTIIILLRMNSTLNQIRLLFYEQTRKYVKGAIWKNILLKKVKR